jgi:hypothetical protein
LRLGEHGQGEQDEGLENVEAFHAVNSLSEMTTCLPLGRFTAHPRAVGSTMRTSSETCPDANRNTAG